MATISIEIETGNEGMQTPEHVAGALRRAAVRMEDGGTSGPIRDHNGNTVGHWEIVGEWTDTEEADPADLWAAVGEDAE